MESLSQRRIAGRSAHPRPPHSTTIPHQAAALQATIGRGKAGRSTGLSLPRTLLKGRRRCPMMKQATRPRWRVGPGDAERMFGSSRFATRFRLDTLAHGCPQDGELPRIPGGAQERRRVHGLCAANSVLTGLGSADSIARGIYPRAARTSPMERRLLVSIQRGAGCLWKAAQCHPAESLPRTSLGPSGPCRSMSHFRLPGSHCGEGAPHALGSNVRHVIPHVLVPLLLGGMVYVLFRRESLLMFRWFEALGLGRSVAWLRAQAGTAGERLPRCAVMSLPAALWLYSLTAWVRIVWRKSGGNGLRVWLLVALAMGAGSEAAQLLGALPGCFDPVDLALYLFAFLSAAVIVRERRAHA